MSCSRMKRILLIILALASIPLAWGYDSTQVDVFEFRKADGTQIALASVNRELGLLSMKIVRTGTEYTHALVKIQGTNGIWYLVDQCGMTFNISKVDAILGKPSDFRAISRMTVGLTDFNNLTLHNKEKIYFETLTSEVLPVTSADGSTCIRPLVKDPYFTLVNISQAMTYSSGGVLSVSIKMFKKSGGADHYMFSWKPEYFNGERDTIGKYAADTYESRCKSILNTCWPVYLDKTAKNSNDSTIKSSLAFALAHDFIAVYTGKLQGSSLEVCIKNNELPLPLKLDDQRIASILRNSYECPYIAEYLRINYDSQKTLASEYVALADESYDWKEYGFITPDKGKDLARAALRYFTWGVEYTPTDEVVKVTAKELPELDRDHLDVFTYNYDVIKSWLYSDSGKRTENYYAGPFVDTTTKLETICDLSKRSGRSLLNTIDKEIVQYIFKDKDGFYQPGNPIPYSSGGRDSPRSFNYKLVEQWKARVIRNKVEGKSTSISQSTRAYAPIPSAKKLSKGALKERYTNYITLPKGAQKDGFILVPEYGEIKPFRPGETKDYSYAGVDEMGFLMGSIAMTSLYDDVQFVNNSKQASALDEYYDFKANSKGIDLLGDAKGGGPGYGKGYLTTMFYPKCTVGEIERISALIPINNIRVGDIILSYGTDNSKNDTISHVGIVVSVPSDISHVSEILVNTKVVHVSKALGCVRLDYLNNFDPSTSGDVFTVRRLLAKDYEKTTDRPTRATDWDVLDRKPAALAVSIKKDTDWERWIPNTGEYYSFKLDVRVLNAGGYAIKAENILDSNTFVRIDPPVDRKIDSSLQFADASNILKNNGTGFELVIEPKKWF